jgi:hypothetical protein
MLQWPCAACRSLAPPRSRRGEPRSVAAAAAADAVYRRAWRMWRVGRVGRPYGALCGGVCAAWRRTRSLPRHCMRPSPLPGGVSSHAQRSTAYSATQAAPHPRLAALAAPTMAAYARAGAPTCSSGGGGGVRRSGSSRARPAITCSSSSHDARPTLSRAEARRVYDRMGLQANDTEVGVHCTPPPSHSAIVPASTASLYSLYSLGGALHSRVWVLAVTLPVGGGRAALPPHCSHSHA